MKVGVEGIPLFGNRSGVGQYTKRLLEASSHIEADIDFEVIRLSMPHKRKIQLPIKPNKHLSYRIARWMPPIVYHQTYKRTGKIIPYNLAVLRKYNAVLFFNFVTYPLTKGVKSIVVIHDLGYLHHREFISPKNLTYMEKFVPKSLKMADRVIAVSENTKKDIIEFFKIDPDKITVIPPAVDHYEFKPQTENTVREVTSKFNINRPYILSVGTIEPRKNLVGVLEAFEMLPENIKQQYSLVLVGGKGWLDNEIQEKYERLSKKYSIIKTGYVDDQDLPALYSGASVFVYPSFFEGFGIPPLEAMACGAPVITSDNSSLPEVVGDAAIMIKANETNTLARKIEEVLTDKNLAAKLSKNGIEQAKKFSWDKSAKTLIGLLKELTDS